jgi:hypothetical protein
MNPLAETQTAFWNAVRTGETFEGAMPHTRMEIYRRAYWVRQVNALRELFPVLCGKLGDAGFNTIALRFIEEQPSKQSAIEWMGAEFPAWLRAQGYSVDAELASYDFVAWEVVVAPDQTSLSEQSAEAPELARSMITLGRHIRSLPLSTEALSFLGHDVDGGGLVLWRREYKVARLPASAGHLRAVSLASHGATFSSICDAFDEDPKRIVVAIRSWFARGWVTSLEVL